MRETIEQYAELLFRICLIQLCNEHDAEDALQEIFLRYMTKSPAFADATHEKAWLIKVAVNLWRDMNRFKARHRHVNINDLNDYVNNDESLGILEILMTIPLKYKSVVHLFYIERYDVKGVSDILGISAAAVKKRLQRAREWLKLEYEKEWEI